MYKRLNPGLSKQKLHYLHLTNDGYRFMQNDWHYTGVNIPTPKKNEDLIEKSKNADKQTLMTSLAMGEPKDYRYNIVDPDNHIVNPMIGYGC